MTKKSCANCDKLNKNVISLENDLNESILNHKSNCDDDWWVRLYNWFINRFKETGFNINIVIKSFFYLCIIGSVLFAGYKFSTDVLPTKVVNLFQSKENIKKIQSPEKISNDVLYSIKKDSVSFSKEQLIYIKKKVKEEAIVIANSKVANKDIGLLKIIEHIFLYLIPLLIFLGLYSYYKVNFENQFLGIRQHSNESIKKAKDSLQLTKTLFLSSIMSYVIIKIVEKVVISKDDISLPKLIGIGVFLFLLMLYLTLSHKGEHQDSGE